MTRIEWILLSRLIPMSCHLNQHTMMPIKILWRQSAYYYVYEPSVMPTIPLMPIIMFTRWLYCLLLWCRWQRVTWRDANSNAHRDAIHISWRDAFFVDNVNNAVHIPSRFLVVVVDVVFCQKLSSKKIFGIFVIWIFFRKSRLRR